MSGPARQCMATERDGTRCALLTSHASSRCEDHRHQRHSTRRNPVYDDPRWHALRKAVLAQHRLLWGELCPGWGEQPHLATSSNPLSVDHVKPLNAGGAPFARSNTQVLCVRCNGRKDAKPSAEQLGRTNGVALRGRRSYAGPGATAAEHGARERRSARHG